MKNRSAGEYDQRLPIHFREQHKQTWGSISLSPKLLRIQVIWWKLEGQSRVFTSVKGGGKLLSDMLSYHATKCNKCLSSVGASSWAVNRRGYLSVHMALQLWDITVRCSFQMQDAGLKVWTSDLSIEFFNLYALEQYLVLFPKGL